MLLTEANQGAVPGIDGWDAPRLYDGSSQKTDRGHSAGYASTDVSPNLCPGLPFIRSTRGSSYDDACTIKTLRAESERERELPRLGWSTDLVVHPVRLRERLVNSVVFHIYRSDRQE